MHRRLRCAVALSLLAVFACTDHGVEPTARMGGALILRPQYSAALTGVEIRPISKVRLTARNAATGEQLAQVVHTVDPAASEWQLDIDVRVTAGPLDVIVTVELIHEGAGGDVVEASGRVPVKLAPGTSVSQVIQVHPGPLEYLDLTGIRIAAAPERLLEDDVGTVVAEVTGGVAPRLFWGSSAPDILEVDAEGALRARAPGRAVIRVSAGAHRDSVTIDVGARPVRMLVSPPSAVADRIGADLLFLARVEDRRGAALPLDVAWAVATGTSVEHRGGGSFRVLDAGPATIVATLPGTSLSASAQITVGLRPASVAVSPATALLTARGATLALTAVVADAGGTPISEAPVAWTSSDTGVLSVSPAGLVTAVADGLATVTARSELNGGSAQGTAQVRVARAPHGSEIVSGEGQTAPVGTVVPVAVGVRVTDAAGAPIPGIAVTFAVAGGGGSLASGAAQTDANGLATAGAWTLGTVPGENTLRVEVAGLPPLIVRAAAVAGPPAVLAIDAGDGQTALAGQAVAVPPTVRVSDAFDNPVPGVSIAFVIVEGDGELSAAGAVSGVDGRASVGWTLGGAGVHRVAASAAGLSPVTFTAEAAIGPPAALDAVAGDGQSGRVGTVLDVAPAVRLADAAGSPIAGVEVTFAVSGGGSLDAAVATTDADGVAQAGAWRLGTRAGQQTVEASAAGLSASFTAMALAGPATELRMLAGDGQSAPVGTAVAEAPAVRVVDAHDNPVAGVTVTFGVASGGGSVSEGTAVSDVDGIAASGAWTLGPTPGRNTLVARAAGLEPVEFTATGRVGVAAAVEAHGGDGQSGVVGAALGSAIAVRVTDAAGNPVAGVPVTFTPAQGSGSASPSSILTDDEGIAATAWTLGDAPGTHQLTASTPVGDVGFSATAVPAAPAAIIAVDGVDQQAPVGSAVPTPPAVRVSDAFGNVLEGVLVTFDIVSGGGSITGPEALTDAAGVARLGSWTLGSPGENRLEARVGSLDPVIFRATGLATCAPMPITLGEEVAAEFSTGDCMIDGVPVDRYAFTLGEAAPVLVELGPGDHAYRFDLLRDGIHVFAVTTVAAMPLAHNLILPPGEYVLMVRPNGESLLGPYTLLAALDSDQGNRCGYSILSGITAQLAITDTDCRVGEGPRFDTFGIRVPAGQARRFTFVAEIPVRIDVRSVNNVTVATSGEPVTNPTLLFVGTADHPAPWQVRVTAGDASATGAYTITAEDATAPDALLIHEGNNQAAPAGAAVAIPPSVRVLDADDAPVHGVMVTFTAGAAGGSVAPATVVTDADGIARVASWTLGGLGPHTLEAAIAGLDPVVFQAQAVGPGGVQLVSGNDQIGTAGSPLELPLVVRVRNGLEAPEAGVTVAWTIDAGGGSLVAETVSDADGLARATLTLGTTGGINRVTAHVEGRDPVHFRADALHGDPVLFDDDFDADNSGVAVTGVTTLRHWDVIAGAADLRGNGVDDAMPGHGLYLDLRGTIRSRTAFAVQPGNYLLVYHAAGQTGSAGDFIEARLGGDIAASIGFNGPLPAFFRRAGSVRIDEAGSAHVEIANVGANSVGTLLDRVTLTRQTGPAALRKWSESNDEQTGTAGQPLPLPIRVALDDENGDPFGHRDITFTPSSGGMVRSLGGGTPAASVTIPGNNFGVASVEWILGPAAGPQTLTVAADGVPPVTFTATATAPGAVHWTNPAGGNWNTAANWDAGRVPTASDDVVIDLDGSYTVDITTAAVAARVELGGASGSITLRVSNELSLQDGMVISPHGVLQLNSNIHTVDGAVENHGLVNLLGNINTLLDNYGTVVRRPGASTVREIRNDGVGTIVLMSNNGSAHLNVDAEFRNHGMVELTGTSWGSIIIAGGGLFNDPGGVMRMLGTADHQMAAAVHNRGMFDIDRSVMILNTGRVFSTADGSIDIAAGAFLRIQSGRIDLSENSALIGPGGVELHGVITVEAQASFVFEADGPVWSMPGSADFHAPGSFTNRSLLNITHDRFHAPFLNQGVVTVVTGHSANFEAGFTNAAEGTVTLNGNNGPSTLTVVGTLTNRGDIELTGTSWSGIIVADELINYETGVITTSGGTGSHAFIAPIENHGRFAIDQGATVFNTSRTLSAMGGTFEVAAGRTLTVNSGTVLLDNASVFSGPGTLALAGVVAVEVNGDYTFAADGLNWTMPGSVDFTATGTLINRSTLRPTHDRFHSPLINEGSLIVEAGHGATFNAGLTNAADGLLRIVGSNGPSEVTVTGGDLTNHGHIEMTGTSWAAMINAGRLVNSVDGVILTTGGAGGHGFSAAIENHGRFDIQQNATVHNASRVLDAFGGTFDIAAGRVLSVNHGLVRLTDGAVFSGPGTISLAGIVSVEVDGDYTFAAGGVQWVMPGNVDFTATGTLINRTTMRPSHDRFHAPFVNEGNLVVETGNGATFNAGLTNGPDGMLLINGNNGPSSVTVDNHDLVNDGSIELTGTSWAASINATRLVNTADGVILTTGLAGGHGFNAMVENQGRFDIQQNATVHNTAGALDALGGTFEVTAGRVLTINGGIVRLTDASVFSGAGTLSLAGNISVEVNGDYTFAADGLQWSMPGSVDFTATGSLTNRSTLRPTHDRFHSPFTNDGTVIVEAGHGAVFNHGLRNTADGVLIINGSNGLSSLTVNGDDLVNEGTIELTGTSWPASITAGRLVNAASGVVVTTGTAGGHGVNAAVEHHGRFDIQQNATIVNTSRTLDAHSGTFEVAAGRTLGISGGTVVLAEASVFAGAGTLSLLGTIAVEVDGDFTFAADGLVWSMPGSVDFTATGTLTNRSTLRPTHDRFHSPFVNEGAVIVEAGHGAVFNLGLRNTADAMLRINGSNGLSSLTVNGDDLLNDGTIELTGTSWSAVVSADRLVNGASGVVLTTGAAGGHVVNAAVEHHGRFDIQQNATIVNASRTLDAHSGTFDVAAGRTLGINGGIVVLSDAAVFAGAGTLSLLGTLAVEIDGDFTFPADGLVWSMPGSVDFTATGTITNRGTLRPTNDRFHSPFTNEAELIIEAGTGGTFEFGLHNAPAGLLRINGSNGPSFLSVNGGDLVNDGTIELTGTSWSAAINAGRLVNNVAGLVTLQGVGGHILNTVLDNGGTFNVERSGTLSRASAQHVNSGMLSLISADLTVSQSGDAPAFTNTGTIDIGPGRMFRVTAGPLLNDGGGVIEGAGILRSDGTFANAGTIRPGGTDAGQLTVQGSLQLLEGSVLELQIDGPGAGTQYDVLTVSGALSLDGALNVQRDPDYVPDVGVTFNVIPAGSASGSFATTSGLGIPPDRELSLEVQATVVRLVTKTTSAAVSITSISRNGLPVNPTNVQGSIDVALNTNPGTQNVRTVVLMLGGQEVFRRTFPSGMTAAEVITATFDTAEQIDGSPRFPNGTYTLQARVLDPAEAILASASMSLTLNN